MKESDARRVGGSYRQREFFSFVSARVYERKRGTSVEGKG